MSSAAVGCEYGLSTVFNGRWASDVVVSGVGLMASLVGLPPDEAFELAGLQQLNDLFDPRVAVDLVAVDLVVVAAGWVSGERVEGIIRRPHPKHQKRAAVIGV